MMPPVRTVCNDCLQSLELVPDDSGVVPTSCPKCGGSLDSRLSDIDTPSSNVTLPLGGAGPDGKRWSETWTRGNLGMIGRFQLREVLGDGGFGIVYKAYDPRLDRDVALKVLKAADPGERVMQRFFREARAAARLRHPSIVAVHDAGFHDGRCWVAYEYVEGRPLNRHLESQKLSIVAAVRIVRDLAFALEHAHEQGVYHRDLKPANIMIDALGRPYVIDLGLSRRADLDSDLTNDGAILGTTNYMSPEQADGKSHLADDRSDIYSLGVIAFELLTGERPANAPSRQASWQSNQAKAPPAVSPRSVNKDVPISLAKMVARALALNPNDRYPDARAFGRDLDRWLQSREGFAAGPKGAKTFLMGIAATCLVWVCVQFVMTLASEGGRWAGPGTQPHGMTGAASAASSKLEEGLSENHLANLGFTPESPIYSTSSSSKSHLYDDCQHVKKSGIFRTTTLGELMTVQRDWKTSLCNDCLGKAARRGR